jgi:hypothetical protein
VAGAVLRRRYGTTGVRRHIDALPKRFYKLGIRYILNLNYKAEVNYGADLSIVSKEIE